MSRPPRDGAVDLVLFLLDGERYGLPVASAERVFPMVAVSSLPGAPAVVLGVINLRGRIVPVLDVRKRLGFAPREYGLTSHLLVARTPRRTVALPVDRVLGVVEVPTGAVTSPESVLPGLGQVAGMVALSDGVLFIHDLDAFLSLDEERELADALREEVG